MVSLTGKREFLMLAHRFKNKPVYGWMMSEKLDGVRCFWDGGITRGMLAREVPWANIEKDARLVKEPISTGLWTRKRKVIYAPDFFCDALPRGVLLDGELTTRDRDRFQDVVSITRSHDSNDWDKILYRVFDSPWYNAVFSDGNLDGRILKGIGQWWLEKAKKNEYPPLQFLSVVKYLDKFINDIVNPITQIQLPFDSSSEVILQNYMEEILSMNGEGIMLRDPYSMWLPKRSYAMLKLKGILDDEAKVIGMIFGNGKLAGMMGALIVRWTNGEGIREFQISGFTNEERTVSDPAYATRHEGEIAPAEHYCLQFPVGTTITFKYRSLTEDGIPKEAQYYRKRTDE